MNINLSYLIVEGTRRCNMKCPHCLRGAAQRVDMDTRIANIVTRQLDSIFCITFSGGEPSLNADIIREFQYGFIFNDCSLGRFWVTTNARSYKEDFANALENLYSLCSDREECCLTISGDQYHFNQSERAINEYSELCFFSDERMRFIEDHAIINEGYAKKNQFGFREITPSKKIKEYSQHGDDLYIDDTIYINALGDVLLDCDMSYQTQKKHVLGNVLQESLKDILIRNLADSKMEVVYG